MPFYTDPRKLLRTPPFLPAGTLPPRMPEMADAPEDIEPVAPAPPPPPFPQARQEQMPPPPPRELPPPPVMKAPSIGRAIAGTALGMYLGPQNPLAQRAMYGKDQIDAAREYEANIAAMKTQADLDQKETMAWRNRQAGIAEGARADAELARRDSLNRPRGEAVGGYGYYDREGAWHPAPPKPMEVTAGASLMTPEGKLLGTAPKPEVPPAPRNVSRGGTLVGPDGKVVYQDNRPPLRGNGDDGKPRIANQETFAGIENRKQTRLAEAEKRARTRIDRDSVDPKTAYADLEAEKMRIQESYLAEIKAAGGSVGGVPPTQPAPPKFQVGQTVRLKSGQTVRVKAINPDGTFDYE